MRRRMGTPAPGSWRGRHGIDTRGGRERCGGAACIWSSWHFHCSVRGVKPSPAGDARAGLGVRIVSALVVAASAGYFWATNVADEDLWNHLTFGELKLRTLAVPHVEASSYSAPGHAWFNHEWGSEVVFALLYRAGGTPGLFALKFGVGLAILAAILATARTLAGSARDGRPHPVTTAAALVVVFAALAPGASFRPQLFTMLCLALEWWLLVRTDARLFASDPGRRVGWELALVPAIVLVWTNAHGGFPVGVGLCVVFVAGVLGRTVAARAWHEPRPPARTLALVVAAGVATLAATVVNPYGLGLHRYLATTLADHGRIAEWLPIPLWSTAHLPFELLALTTAACAVPWVAARRVRSARIDWRLAFLALAFVSALRHQRHSVLFVVVAAPVCLAAAEHVRRRAIARWPALAPRPPVVATIALGALAVAALQVAQVTARYAQSGLAIRYAREEFPADAVEFLRTNGIRGNLAAQFEWGGYALHHLGDAVRVFIDGRYEACYPPGVIDDYFAFVEASPDWSRVLDAYPTDVVLLDRTDAVVPHLDGRPDFVRAYADPTAVVYLRRTPANDALLAALGAVATREPTTPRATFFP
jgi:hypothetical protein